MPDENRHWVRNLVIIPLFAIGKRQWKSKKET